MRFIEICNEFSTVSLFFTFFHGHEELSKAIIYLPAAVWGLWLSWPWCLKASVLISGRAGHSLLFTAARQPWYQPSGLWQLTLKLGLLGNQMWEQMLRVLRVKCIALRIESSAQDLGECWKRTISREGGMMWERRCTHIWLSKPGLKIHVLGAAMPHKCGMLLTMDFRVRRYGGLQSPPLSRCVL